MREHERLCARCDQPFPAHFHLEVEHDPSQARNPQACNRYLEPSLYGIRQALRELKIKFVYGYLLGSKH